MLPTNGWRYALVLVIALAGALSAYGIADERQRRTWQQRGWAIDREIYRVIARRRKGRR